jgi:hypothetical protein
MGSGEVATGIAGHGLIGRLDPAGNTWCIALDGLARMLWDITASEPFSAEGVEGAVEIPKAVVRSMLLGRLDRFCFSFSAAKASSENGCGSTIMLFRR